MTLVKALSIGLAAAAITAVFGIGQVAQAQISPAPARTVAIHYGDLDLASETGRSALGHRIRQAVGAACGEASSADLRGANAVLECRRDLTASLAGQRDAVLAAARSGGSPATLVARR